MVPVSDSSVPNRSALLNAAGPAGVVCCIGSNALRAVSAKRTVSAERSRAEAVFSLTTANRLLRSGLPPQSVLVLRPQTISELQTPLPGSTAVWFTVDHYVHGEQLRAAIPAGRITVLLHLQGTGPGGGVRPGRDAVRLAAGLSGIPGLCVTGLLTDVQTNGELDDAIAAARHTRRLLQREIGVACECMCVRMTAQMAAEGHRVLCDETWRVIPVAVDRDDSDGPRIPGSADDIPSGGTGHVVSRPSLEQVVVHVDCPAALRPEVVICEPEGAGIIGWRFDCCVAACQGDAVNLTIGDTVTWCVPQRNR